MDRKEIETLKFFPRKELIDGSSYYGLTDDKLNFDESGLVATWNAKSGFFTTTVQRWDQSYNVVLNHPDDENEYFDVFWPVSVE